MINEVDSHSIFKFIKGCDVRKFCTYMNIPQNPSGEKWLRFENIFIQEKLDSDLTKITPYLAVYVKNDNQSGNSSQKGSNSNNPLS